MSLGFLADNALYVTDKIINFYVHYRISRTSAMPPRNIPNVVPSPPFPLPIFIESINYFVPIPTPYVDFAFVNVL